MMEIETITLAEIWEAGVRADCNGADKPRFRAIMEQLNQSPGTSERLVFETIQEIRNCLQRKMEPWTLAGWVFSWSGAVGQTKLSDFLDAVEEVICAYFTAIPELQYCTAEITLPRL